jgi:hypothetical protein
MAEEPGLKTMRVNNQLKRLEMAGTAVSLPSNRGQWGGQFPPCREKKPQRVRHAPKCSRHFVTLEIKWHNLARNPFCVIGILHSLPFCAIRRCERSCVKCVARWSFIQEIPWANHIGGKMGLFPSARVAQEMAEERLYGYLHEKPLLLRESISLSQE